jgi:opacity protein-like surface antigen
MKKLLFGCVAFVAVAAKAASAADLPPAPAPVPYYKAPAVEPAYDWTGFYIGGHFSYGWTHSTGQTTDTANGRVFPPGSTDTSAAHGGGQIGYDYMLPSRVVIGILADVSSGTSRTVVNANAFQTSENASDGKVNGSVRGRLGYAFDTLLVYGTGGWGWNDATATRTQVAGTVGNATPGTAETTSTSHDTWTVGTGLDYAFARNWDAFVEYRYSHSAGNNTVTFPIAGFSTSVSSYTNVVEAGINWRFNGNGPIGTGY